MTRSLPISLGKSHWRIPRHRCRATRMKTWRYYDATHEEGTWQKKCLSIAMLVEAPAIKRWSIYRRKAFPTQKKMSHVTHRPCRNSPGWAFVPCPWWLSGRNVSEVLILRPSTKRSRSRLASNPGREQRGGEGDVFSLTPVECHS